MNGLNYKFEPPKCAKKKFEEILNTYPYKGGNSIACVAPSHL